MRSLIKNGIKAPLKEILNTAGVGFSDIYQKHHFSFNAQNNQNNVTFNKIAKIDDEKLEKIIIKSTKKIKTFPKGNLINLAQDNVIRFPKYDIELSKEDGYGQFVVGTLNGLDVYYGDEGISTSKNTNALDLAKKYHLKIEPKSYGVLDVKKHVPILFSTKNPEKNLVMTTSEIEKVYDHDENISRYSLDIDYHLDPEDAKRYNLAVQRRILYDKASENFYEETTTIVDKPTRYNKSSGTLMSFEGEEMEKDKTTDMHYHPGDRVLQIITRNKRSGVTLNFCGINENPDERQDCKVEIQFPKNSVLTLKFPSCTHHKFHGDFVCKSIHPNEKENIIESLQKGTLPSGFLESATVFSKTNESNEKWNSSLPSDPLNNNNTKSNSR